MFKSHIIKTTLFNIGLSIAAFAAIDPAAQSSMDACYNRFSNILGNSTSDYVNLGNGFYRQFENGNIYYNSSAGAHEIHGKALCTYKSLGGTEYFGYPLSDSLPSSTNGSYWKFTNSALAASAYGVFEIKGAIYNKFNLLNGIHGTLGFPVSREITCSDGKGKYMRFEYGAIYYSPDVNNGTPYYMTGKILALWDNAGAEKSSYGYPAGDPVITDGIVQKFQNDSISTIISDGLTYTSEKFNAFKISGYISSDISASAVNLQKSGFKVSSADGLYSTSSDASGYFELWMPSRNTSDGEIKIQISKTSFLTRQVSISYIPQKDYSIGNVTSPVMMWAGDVSSDIYAPGNDTINEADVNTVSKCYNSSAGDINYIEAFDFDKDGSINLIDIMQISKHLNAKTADYPVQKVETSASAFPFNDAACEYAFYKRYYFRSHSLDKIRNCDYSFFMIHKAAHDLYNRNETKAPHIALGMLFTKSAAPDDIDFDNQLNLSSPDKDQLLSDWDSFSKDWSQYGNVIYVSDMNWTTVNSGWGPAERDISNGESRSGDGKIITLNGITYQKGLGVHAPSEIVYKLNGQFSRFVSDIGVDDEIKSNATVVFQVVADGVPIYKSGIINPDSPTGTIDLSVNGVQELRLQVTDAGDGVNSDHADWAGAFFTR